MLQRRFFAGLITVVPAIVTLWALRLFIDLIDWLVADRIRPIVNDLFLILGWPTDKWLVGVTTFAISVTLSLGLVVVIGTVSKLYLGRRLIRLGESIVERIPIIRLFYATPKEVLRILMNSQSATTKRMVMVEFPRPGVWALAYATGEMRRHDNGQLYVTVFMPSTPNPTTGFLMLVPEDQVRDYNLTTETSVRMIISGGILSPDRFEMAPFTGMAVAPPFTDYIGVEQATATSPATADDDHTPAR